jgi:hypothetical protein
MLKDFACNLITTLSYPPWREELYWGLYTTIKWEKRVPFHAHIRRNGVASSATRRDPLFPEFGALPTELQLRILALCPANTLFQVMRALPGLRTEASKLFWAAPTIFFLIKASWLLDGGYPGFTHCDLHFLSYAQKVEIDYRPGDDDTLCPIHDETYNTRQDVIVRFWTSLMQRLPNTKQVIIVQNWLTPSWRRDKEPVAHPMRMLIQACPPGIDVAAIVLENAIADTHTPLLPTTMCQRSLYRPAAAGGWTKSHELEGSITVLPPTKQFTGPVGDFQRLANQREIISYQQYGLWPLMIEALDRHYFDKERNTPFTCPIPNCNTYFTRAGEWTVHAVELHCEAWHTENLTAILPDKLGAIFKQRFDALVEMGRSLDRQYITLKNNWMIQSEENQRDIKRRWMDQLRNDPAWDTGKKAEESRLWTEFWHQLCPPEE